MASAFLHTARRGAVASLVGTLCLAGTAHATTFNVNTTADTHDAALGNPACLDAGGNCSLRAAIDQANNDGSNDTINVPNGRYVLTIKGTNEDANDRGDLDLGNATSGDLSIVGQSVKDTIVDADGIDRVFHSRGSGDVEIANLTVTGGSLFGEGGAGILNEATTLTLNGVRVTRNITFGGGGGVSNTREAIVLDSTIDRNTSDEFGGGICTEGTLTVDGSTLSDNVGRNGGGLGAAPSGCNAQPSFAARIALNGVAQQTGVSVENSTIDGNNSESGGGGGVAVRDRNLSLLNVTLTDNHAEGDTNGGGGAQTQDFSNTLSQGIAFQNTIIADNRTNGERDNCTGDPASFADNGNNLENIDDCGLTQTSSKKNTPALLERLADNGGPTFTRALRDGSAAIDGGNNAACPDADQRGEDRPPRAPNAGAACDIGAYEKVTPPAPQQPVQQPQQPQAPAPCTATPPRTSISRNGLDAANDTVKFVGRSIDFLCAESKAVGGVTRVQVSVTLVVGKRCRFLGSDGKLGGSRNCTDRVFQNAKLGTIRNGKVPWTFRKRRLELPNGRYIVTALATDNQDGTESQIRKFNQKRFRIR